MSGWAAQCTVTTLLKVTIERNMWGRVMYIGELSFPLVHAFQANIWTKGNLSGSSFHQKSLPYRLNHFSLTIHSRSYGLGPWVTKIIPGFAGFFNDFYWKKYKHTSCYISSGLTGILLLAVYPLSRQDPFFGLTKILFFFFFSLLLLFLSFSFFLGFWAFIVLFNFMNWAFFC